MLNCRYTICRNELAWEGTLSKTDKLTLIQSTITEKMATVDFPSNALLSKIQIDVRQEVDLFILLKVLIIR